MKRLLFIVVAFTFCIGHAQINISTGGTVTAGSCGNTFVDSGGTGGDYGYDENYQITICPDTPGTYIQFEFTSFDVEGEPYDFLTFYEGTGTGGTVIGTYGDTTRQI